MVSFGQCFMSGVVKGLLKVVKCFMSGIFWAVLYEWCLLGSAL